MAYCIFARIYTYVLKSVVILRFSQIKEGRNIARVVRGREDQPVGRAVVDV